MKLTLLIKTQDSDFQRNHHQYGQIKQIHTASKTTRLTDIGGGGETVPAGGRAPNPAHIYPAVIPFAPTPLQANTAVPIDYTSTMGGIKLFNSAILNLLELFDG